MGNCVQVQYFNVEVICVVLGDFHCSSDYGSYLQVVQGGPGGAPVSIWDPPAQCGTCRNIDYQKPKLTAQLPQVAPEPPTDHPELFKHVQIEIQDVVSKC